MTSRRSLRDHDIRKPPGSAGREAIYASPDTSEASSTEDRPQPIGTWENNHRRVTFYCSLELVQKLEAEITRSGRSKSRVIVDAIQAHLNTKK